MPGRRGLPTRTRRDRCPSSTPSSDGGTRAAMTMRHPVCWPPAIDTWAGDWDSGATGARVAREEFAVERAESDDDRGQTPADDDPRSHGGSPARYITVMYRYSYN